MSKKFYHGELNFYGETHNLYRWAFTEEQALLLFTNEIGSLVKRSGRSVYLYFKGKPLAYKIKEEEYKRREKV
jgi:hypothetical protein